MGWGECGGGGGARVRAIRVVMSGPASPWSQHVRSLAEWGTKRPAHSCSLTQGRHVARRRPLQPQLCPKLVGRRGRATSTAAGSAAGNLLHALCKPLCSLPPARGFPKTGMSGRDNGAPLTLVPARTRESQQWVHCLGMGV